MKNWKTTAAGVASILAVVAKYLSGEMLGVEDLGMLTAGAGLLGAKDHNVTGGTKEQ